MTLFRRTEQAVEELEKLLATIAPDSIVGSDVKERKRQLDNALRIFDEVSPAVSKMRKAAEDTNPASRTYGEQMAAKVLALCARFDALEASRSTIEQEAKNVGHEVARLAEEEKRAVQAVEAAKVAAAEAAAAEAEAAKAAAAQAAAAKAEATAARDSAAKRDAAEKAAFQAQQAQKAAAENHARDDSRPATTGAAETATSKTALAGNGSAEATTASKSTVASSPSSKAMSSDAGSSDGELVLNIKSNTGEGAKSVSVPSKELTVLRLKEAIEASMGHAPATQRLIFSGKVLDNAKTLASYSIRSGVTLHLVVSASLAGGSPGGSASTGDASSPAGPAPLAGKVHEVLRGSVEMRQLLTTAGSKLVVVDWYAPWCGPCRGMAPHFDALAQEHQDVIFAKVDTEASGENKALAMEAAIRAFPTFHLYRNSQRVHSFTGADPAKLRDAIDRNKPPSTGTPAVSSEAAQDDLADELTRSVKVALVNLKSSCSTDAEFVAACKTLLSFVGNPIHNPDEAKYRRIRKGNSAFQNRLGSKRGGIEALLAFGFREITDGNPPEEYLVLDTVSPEMVKVKELLEKAVPGGSSASQTPVAASASPAAGAFGLPAGMGLGMPGTGGMGPMGGMGGDQMQRAMEMMQNPVMRRLTERMMSNPAMMQAMQSATQNGNPSSLMFDPAFAETMRNIMQDPEMQAAMQDPSTIQQMMSYMGGGGASALGGIPFGGAGMSGFSGTNGGASGGGGFGVPLPSAPSTQPAPTTPATPLAPVTAPPANGGTGTDDADADEQAMLAEALRLSMEEGTKDQEHKE